MFENFRMIKEWYKIARPKFSSFIWQFVTYFIHALCIVVAPIFSAKVISRLSTGDFKEALIYLSLVFILLIIRNIAMSICYKNSNTVFDQIYIPLQKRIINKVIYAKDKNFVKTKKEKILNIYHSAVYNISCFGKIFACGTSKLLRLLVTIVVVITINPIVALILVGVDILNFFILNNLYSKIANSNKIINNIHDKQNVVFADIFDSKDMLDEMKLKNKAEREFLSISSKLSSAYGTRTLHQNKIDQIFFVFYNTIVFAITFILILLVSKNSLTLENYLVIVPYLTTGITDANEFYAMFTDLKTTNVHCERLKTILEFTEKDIIEFGKNRTDEIVGSLDFNNVYYKKGRSSDHNLPEIKNINIHIRDNEATLFLGPRNCGKRTLFYLLRRIVQVKNGSICVSGININEYSNKIYNSNITYCTTKPFFFRGSIMKNLKMVESKKDKIFEMCKRLNIYESIISLPGGFNAEPNRATLELQYLIGLCRSLLTKSEICILYEFPNTLTDNQKTKVSNVLSQLKRTRTLIIFSANDYIANISDKIAIIEDGEIKKIYLNN